MVKNTSKLALGGMMGALSLVCLLLTLFPFATYALPCLAGVFLFPVIIECGKRTGAAVYAATALLALLITPDLEAKALYVAFFGYYPLLKSVAEARRSRIREWLIKLGSFNAAAVLAYTVLAAVGLNMEEFVIPGLNLSLQVVLLLFLLAGNVIFVLYDIGLTRALPLYFSRFQPLLRRLLK